MQTTNDSDGRNEELDRRVNDITALFGSMAPQKGALVRLLEACAEPRTYDQLGELVAGRHDLGVFDLSALLRILEEKGALERSEASAQAEAPEAQDGAKAEFVWTSTEAGRAALAGLPDGFEEARALLAAEPEYRDAYETVLTLCDNDDGAALAELKDAVSALAPEGTKLFAQRFIERLRADEAIEWTDQKTWKTTETGRRLLAELAATDEAGEQ